MGLRPKILTSWGNGKLSILLSGQSIKDEIWADSYFYCHRTFVLSKYYLWERLNIIQRNNTELILDWDMAFDKNRI
jgi:hypothetical protein